MEKIKEEKERRLFKKADKSTDQKSTLISLILMNRNTSATFTFNVLEAIGDQKKNLPYIYPAVFIIEDGEEKLFVPDLSPYLDNFKKQNGLDDMSKWSVLSCNIRLNGTNKIIVKKAERITKYIKGTDKVLIGWIVKN